MIASYFSGIGGLDLAVEALTGHVVGYVSEVDPYASAVLAERFSIAENMGDITNIKLPPHCQYLCGGFPCQGISSAGKRKGLDDDRSGLWWKLHEIIRETRPAVAFLENVAAIRSRGLHDVLASLAGIGFDAEWRTVQAREAGAPHRRARTFILAYSDRLEVRKLAERIKLKPPIRRHSESIEPGRDVADADVTRLERLSQGHDYHWCDASWNDPHGRDQGVVYPPSPTDGEGWAKWVGEGRALPGVRRGAYGRPRGVDAFVRRERLKALGNAVCPRQAYAAFAEMIIAGNLPLGAVTA